MGLVLYSSADGDPSPSCPASLHSFGNDFSTNTFHNDHLADLVAHNRHIPASRGKVRDWRCGPSKTRLTAQRQSALACQYRYDVGMIKCHQESEIDLLRKNGMWRPSLRPHQVRLLQKSSRIYYDRWQRYGEEYHGNYLYDRHYHYKARGTPHVRGQRKSVRDEWLNQTAADAGLVPARRPPSLERQGAFRAASTTKKQMMSPASRPAPSITPSVKDDPDVAELYRLGLLYDDEHERGAGFGLDAIVHNAPLYTVSTASRRGRRTRGKEAEAFAFEDIGFDDDLPPLDLALSFANLGDDAALARFLQDEEMATYLAGASDDIVVPDLASFAPSSSASPFTQPVMVIYELEPEVEGEVERAHTPEPEVNPITDPSEAGVDSASSVIDHDEGEVEYEKQKEAEPLFLSSLFASPSPSEDDGDWDMDMDMGVMDDRQFFDDRRSGPGDILIACPTETDDDNNDDNDDGSRGLDNAWVFLQR
ncbi:hypothetical protein SBRCBS47491_005449 [Sporothrix bragantina]|uniref:Uncharacterized protein n=1 Tax=Sporothrix bragantina TaxID=671064 RepID=A0ABP0BXF8_9PEZI